MSAWRGAMAPVIGRIASRSPMWEVPTGGSGLYGRSLAGRASSGLPTIYMGLTAGLSSSIYAAEQAAQMVRDSHPDFEIYVLDTLIKSQVLCQLS